MGTNRILVVDDSDEFRTEIRKCLSGVFDLAEASSVDQFTALYRPRWYDLVILDMRLVAGREGLDLLRRIRTLDELQPVIMVSAYGDSESILDAAESGALMFLHKQEFSAPLLARMVEAVLRQGHVQRQLAALQARMPHGQPYELGSVTGLMRDVDRQVRRAAADSGVFVVVGGEVGAGHELVAAAIHGTSARRNAGPWVASGADRIVGSPDPHAVLFGSARVGGQRSRGLLEQAHEGVLYLDGFELMPERWRDELAACLQAHVLPGAGQPMPIDVQIVAGTGAQSFETHAAWARARFGAARCVELRLPALSERSADIATLVPHYLRSMHWAGRPAVRAMSQQVQAAFEGYGWPGNLAELRAVVSFAALRACLAGRETIELAHLPASLVGASPDSRDENNYEWHLARAELSLVETALMGDRGHRREHTAQRLGYNDRFALGRRMRRALAAFPHLRSQFPEVARRYGAQARERA
jgi:two-component system, NtrC family, nitrogen regulation response regulator NtrX